MEKSERGPSAAGSMRSGRPWVHDPGVSAVRGCGPALLLTPDRLSREGPLDFPGDEILDREIGVGDHGVVVLPADPDPLEERHEHLARAECQGHRRFEARLRRGPVRRSHVR
jgi:hypothetical protein